MQALGVTLKSIAVPCSLPVGFGPPPMSTGKGGVEVTVPSLNWLSAGLALKLTVRGWFLGRSFQPWSWPAKAASTLPSASTSVHTLRACSEFQMLSLKSGMCDKNSRQRPWAAGEASSERNQASGVRARR